MLSAAPPIGMMLRHTVFAVSYTFLITSAWAQWLVRNEGD